MEFGIWISKTRIDKRAKQNSDDDFPETTPLHLTSSALLPTILDPPTAASVAVRLSFSQRRDMGKQTTILNDKVKNDSANSNMRIPTFSTAASAAAARTTKTAAQSRSNSTLSLARRVWNMVPPATAASTSAWMTPSSMSTRPATRTFATTKRHLEPSSSNGLSSSRALRAVELLPSYLADARQVERYHPIDAPQGALQLGVAESQMLQDLLVPALNQPVDMTSDCIYYQPTHGRPACRESLAHYIQSVLNLDESKSLDVEGMVIGAGCNAVLENLCLCLADVNDAVLIPTPYYAAFEFDLVARANLFVQPVTTQDYCVDQQDTASESSSSDEASATTHATHVDPSVYYPTVAALDAAYEKASQQGHPPKILLLSHPHNPLGICYPKHVLEECIEWCRSRRVHLISDEIYAGSVYQPEQSGFESALTVAAGAEPSEHGGLGLGPYVHWVYAMSKDFALSGLRVGVAYSENPDIRVPLQKLNDLCQISSQTQMWVDSIMRKRVDEKDDSSQLWTQYFRDENHKRLRARCEALMACLEECNIPYLPPTSGLFCWVDLSAYLPANGTASERERALYLELVQEFGLLLTPGDSMRNEEPGFFRIVFTAASNDEFELGLQRLRTFAAAKST